MKNNNVFFYMFMSVWIVLVILNFFNPKKEFSEQENRYLAKVPEFTMEKLVSGEFSNDMNEYFNDHFVFRNAWVKVNSLVQTTTGKDEINNVYVGEDGYLFEKENITEKELSNFEYSANKINTIAETLDIPVYVMIVPNSIYINQDKLPEFIDSPNQLEIINNMYAIMNNTININTVQSIQEQNKIEQLYFKTDHHMTSAGSYVLYQEFAKASNIMCYDNFITEKVSDDFLGTFDAKSQVLNQEKDDIYIYKNKYNQNLEKVIYDLETIDSIYKEDYLSKRDKYSYFLNGNNSKVEIHTKQNNGKKLLIIKDSYAHNFAQFLCGNYEEIHLIDPRYYRATIKDYVNENEITDVLVLYNVSNLAGDLGLRNIR